MTWVEGQDRAQSLPEKFLLKIQIYHKMTSAKTGVVSSEILWNFNNKFPEFHKKISRHFPLFIAIIGHGDKILTDGASCSHRASCVQQQWA